MKNWVTVAFECTGGTWGVPSLLVGGVSYQNPYENRRTRAGAGLRRRRLPVCLLRPAAGAAAAAAAGVHHSICPPQRRASFKVGFGLGRLETGGHHSACGARWSSRGASQISAAAQRSGGPHRLSPKSFLNCAASFSCQLSIGARRPAAREEGAGLRRRQTVGTVPSTVNVPPQRQFAQGRAQVEAHQKSSAP